MLLIIILKKMCIRDRSGSYSLYSYTHHSSMPFSLPPLILFRSICFLYCYYMSKTSKLQVGRSLTDLPALCTDTVVLYQCCSVSSHQMGGFPSSNVEMTDHSAPGQSSSSTGIWFCKNPLFLPYGISFCPPDVYKRQHLLCQRIRRCWQGQLTKWFHH